jgi:glycosyltransferase involved in cell wall biosynthesis
VTSVSVIIRCFNEEEHIGRLLSGLVRQTRPPDQIVIVDSGSTDATLAIASRFPVELHTIEPERFSFGRSLNIGCAAASGDVLALASAHVYPIYDTWLADLTSAFEDDRVALAYGRQVGGDRTKYSERRLMERWFPSQSVARQDHPFCNNANAAIRRSVWQSQPYDEGLTGLEDLDWAKRIMNAGWGIAYVAEAPVVHQHDERWREISNRYEREAIAHRRIYNEQRMGALEAIRLAMGNIVSDYVHAARDGVMLANLRSIPAFRSAQFWGTYRGFGQRGEASAVLRRRFYYPHGWRRQKVGPAPPGARRIDYDEADHREIDVRAD